MKPKGFFSSRRDKHEITLAAVLGDTTNILRRYFTWKDITMRTWSEKIYTLIKRRSNHEMGNEMKDD